MVKRNDRWSALSMSERADLIKLYVSSGVTSLDAIRKNYNSFGEGGDTEPVYYDDTYIEPAVVKAFNSQEDYNRYYGEQFGRQIAEGTNNVAPYVLEAAMLPFTISGALETPMLLYQGVKALPQVVKLGKSAFRKGKKYFGKKILGMVDDMNGYVKEGSHFRIVDKPAIDDAISSGTIRSKTGLYHGVPEYLRKNFSKYLDDIPGWESMDANELKELLDAKGAFNGMTEAEKKIAKFKIGNSTNHGGTVGYFKDTPYPNYDISTSNYVIETPESVGSFVPGHGGEEFVGYRGPVGASLLKTNGSVKGASIPSKGSSYWEYSPFWEMWKNNKFATGGPIETDEYGYPADITPAYGGRILSGEESTESTLSGNSVDNTGIIDRIKGWFNKNQNDSNVAVIDDYEDPTYITYRNAPKSLRMYLTQTKNGKYDIGSKGEYGDTHYDAVEARYFDLTRMMKKKGFSNEEINRLSPFLVTQMILEGGYKTTSPNNNFGGMLDPKTRAKIKFDTEDDFYSAYLDNLDEKWGDAYLGKGLGWRNAKTIEDYARIINREDLKLDTLDKFNEYNNMHKDKPAYIYTPVWENNGTELMSDNKFGGIKDRVNGLIQLINLRQAEFRDLSQSMGWLKTMPLEEMLRIGREKYMQKQ